ncbi:MAG: hypothetical protein ACRENS_01100 [Candidatus Eiseniibacteriota bacterium]
MKLKAILLLLTAAVAFAIPARATTTYDLLFAFTGFDYQNPNTVLGPTVDHSDYLAVSEGYNVVGFVTQFGPLLTPYIDTGTYQYTNTIDALTVVTHTYFGGFLEATFANGGRASYYADALSGGTAADYGVNPPNATSPSTFTDGSLRLTGSVDNFIFDLDYTVNPISGTFSGNMTLDGGADLIYVPVSQRSGWTLGGTAGQVNPTIPAGYDNQVTGECKVLVTPTTHVTWGAIKALYR